MRKLTVVVNVSNHTARSSSLYGLGPVCNSVSPALRRSSCILSYAVNFIIFFEKSASLSLSRAASMVSDSDSFSL